MTSDPKGIRDPVRVIIEDPSATERCRAHVVLGERAMERDDTEKALLHYAEATLLEPEDEGVRTDLERLGQRLEMGGAKARWGLFGRIFGRARRAS